MRCSKIFRLGVSAGLAASGSLAWAQPCDCGAWMEFDGLNDVVVSYADFNTEALTLEAWVRIDGTHPLYASGLITWGTRSQGSYDFCVGPPTDRRLCFFINYNNGTQKTAHGSTRLALREWYHVAVTYDGVVAKLYLNGELDAEQSLGVPINPVGEGARLTIGDDWAGSSEFVHGGFDDVMAWGYARSQEQIQNDMDGGGPNSGETPPMALYTFDECRSNVVLDHSGQGRHAHLGASYDIGSDDPAPHRWSESVGRVRVLQLTSRMAGEIEPIGGPLETQMMCVNHCVTSAWWEPLVNRHADFHQRAQLPCGDILDRPYVDAVTYLTGADEVTRHNCESAFYRFEFNMPPVFEGRDFYGVMNADDMARVHLNGSPISPEITPLDLANFGQDRVDADGHPIVGWPTADPVYALQTELLRPGMNELIVAVASDISEFEPAGMEFIFNVRYECFADWNADGANNSLDFLDYLNDWSSRNPAADLDVDGRITSLDFLLWMNAWTFGCPE